MGNLPTALIHAAETAQIAREIAAPACEMWGELEMGLVLLAQGHPETALEHTRRAVDLVSQGGESWIGTEQIHQAQAQVLRALDRTQEAEKQEQSAAAIVAAKADRILDPEQRRRYLECVKREAMPSALS